MKIHLRKFSSINMNRNLKTSILLLGLVLLAACSNDDDGQVAQEPSQEQKQTTPKSYPLSIEVAENPMIQDGEEGSSSRRAAITTGATFNEFKMDYVYGETPSTGSLTAEKTAEGKWRNKAGGDVGWPDTDATVYWYAYSDGTFNLNGGNPYINFTVEEAAASQHDLLVATASGTYSETGGKLTFTFDHVCSALRFWVKKSTNLNNYKLDVSEIVLCNIVKQAKYYYSTGWDDLYATRSVYTLSSGSAEDLGSGSYIPMDGGTPSYLFLIPQTLTAWDHTTAIASATTQTYLKVKCTITKKSDSSVIYNKSYAYIPFGKVLETNTKYDVNINIGMNSLYNEAGNKIITTP